MNYDFYDPTIPSISGVMQIVAGNATVPSKAQELVLETLQELIDTSRNIERFATLRMDAIPCTGDVLSGLLGQLQSHNLSSRAPLGEACWAFLRQYNLSYPTRWAPYTASVISIADLLPAGHRRRDLNRLLRLGVTGRIDIHRLDESGMEVLRRALQRDPAVQHPDTLWVNAARGWNWAVAELRGWPQRLVTIPITRETHGMPWLAFPHSLKKQTDRYVQVTH